MRVRCPTAYPSSQEVLTASFFTTVVTHSVQGRRHCCRPKHVRLSPLTSVVARCVRSRRHGCRRKHTGICMKFASCNAPSLRVGLLRTWINYAVRSYQRSSISRHGGCLLPGDVAPRAGRYCPWRVRHPNLASPCPPVPTTAKVLTVSYCTLALLALTHRLVHRSIHITVKVVFIPSALFFHL